jgi:hypothetical protein
VFHRHVHAYGGRIRFEILVNAAQSHVAHEPLNGAAGGTNSFAPQLPPNLPWTIDVLVLGPHR